MPTILIVEDDRAARDGLSQLLTGAGFEVTTAADGEEALARLDDSPFDVMLLDIWVPKVNGLELLKRLGDRPGQPKIIITTADDTPETVLQALRKKAHQFVRKPIEPAALVSLVRSAVESSGEPAIVVISARAAWVEVLVSCAREVVDRIQSYMVNLDVDLPLDIRENMGRVFRELLLDAMEWDGHLDPNRKVRIAYLRGQKMMLYRIADAGSGFRATDRPSPGATAPLPAPGSRAANNLLRPGALLARTQADELLFNEAGNEVAVVKYLQ
jgi:CheY-like chemotaxis protein